MSLAHIIAARYQRAQEQRVQALRIINASRPVMSYARVPAWLLDAKH